MDKYIEDMKRMRDYSNASEYWEIDEYQFKVYLEDKLFGNS